LGFFIGAKKMNKTALTASVEFFAMRPYHQNSTRVAIEDGMARLYITEIMVAEYDKGWGSVMITNAGRPSSVIMDHLNAIIEKYDFKITRFGPQWKINEINWDGAAIEVPQDLDLDWVGAVVGIDGAKIINRLRAGEILRGPKHSFAGLSRPAGAVLLDCEGECLAGTPEAFMSTLYTSHTIFKEFVTQRWQEDGELFNQYYRSPISNPMVLRHDGAVFCNGTILCESPASVNTRVKLRQECNHQEIIKLAHQI